MHCILGPLLTVFLLCTALSTQAQGGIRLVLFNAEPVVEGFGISAHYGMGYDHDLNERLSYALLARFDIETDSYAFNYRSAYHFSDNDRGSFYMGPSVGVRKFTEDGGPLLIPIGLQVGVRGGLERFFADVYAGFRYNIGSGKPIPEPGSPQGLSAVPVAYVLGLDIGWGWAGSSKKGNYR